MMICPDKWAFIHVPRTGGTAISATLHSMFPEMHTMARWTHVPIRTARDHVTMGQALAACRTFAFVRNPYARMLSWFGAAGGAGVRLDEARDAYVAFLEQVPARPVWRTAWNLLSIDGELAVDRTGRTETLQEDFVAICDWLDIGRHTPIVDRVNHSRFSAPPDAYYDDRSVALVRKYCAEDFEHFGYDDCHP